MGGDDTEEQVIHPSDPVDVEWDIVHTIRVQVAGLLMLGGFIAGAFYRGLRKKA